MQHHIKHKNILHNNKVPERQPLSERFLYSFIGEIMREAFLHSKTRRVEIIRKSISRLPEYASSKQSFSAIPINQDSRQPRHLLAPARQPFKMKHDNSLMSSSNSPLVQQIVFISTAKLTPLLLDPSVASIECSGHDKPLMLMRSGIAQTSLVVLNIKEIDELLKEISGKTRIPLLPGLFRALLGNLLVTAVISEQVGSRFFIQKRW